MKYRREIDGLRAVAVLPVVFFHAGFELFEGGFIGVDVFFVISGYLIATIILSDMQEGRFSVATFYERRARRILPALFLVMLFCLPVAWMLLLPNHLKDFSQSLSAVSVFSSNILFWRESDYFSTAGELKPLLHTWSLAIEEQYYVIFPLFLMFLWKLRKRWIFTSLMLVAFLSLLAAQWGAYHKQSANFFLLPTRGWELALGALIAFYFLYKKQQAALIAGHKIVSEGLGLMGLFLVAYAVLAFDKFTPFPSFYALVPTIGTALIIIFATEETVVGRLLSSKHMVGIGLISYSIYLWHQPLFAFARHYSADDLGVFFLLSLSALSIILAYLSWRYVESPFRDKKKISRKAVFIFSAAGSAFFAAIGLTGIFTEGFIGRYDSKYHALFMEDDNRRYVPKKAAALEGVDFEDDGRSKVILIGDSFAEDLVNAIYENKYNSRLNISFYKIPAKCGNLFLEEDFTAFIKPRDRVVCRNNGWYENERLKLLMKSADSIWLVSSWTSWQAELIEKSVTNIISEYGDKVVVFGTKNFGEINLKQILSGTGDDSADLINPPDESRKRTNEVMKVKLKNRKFVDLFGLFCGSDYQCKIMDEDNQLLTFDGGHLTRAGAIHYGKILRTDPIFSSFLN